MKTPTVLVTGSSRGIGKEIALKFSKNEYNIVINCNNSVDELKNLETEIKKYNPNILAVSADVSDYNEVCSMFEKIEAKFGNVDILINNAGISHIGLFNQMKPDIWQKLVNVNLLSIFNCSHRCIESMINEKNGVIINISSIWGSTGASCEAVYSATKGGINSFTKALAKELGPCNIRVNAISCGVIDTKMNSFLDKDEMDLLIKEIPLGRLGTTAEVAELAYFLSNNSSKYISGQIIGLDGGFM